MCAEGGRGALQAPLRAPQHPRANGSLSPGSALQGHFPQQLLSGTDRSRSWKHGRKSPSVQRALGSPRALPDPLAAPVPDRDPQAGRGGGTAPSPRFVSAGTPGGAAVPPLGLHGVMGGPPSSEQPWVGCSFSRPASAEVLAAIGTGAAEPVAWQRERVLFPMTNIISIDPDHLPFQMSAQAGDPSKGKCGSPK